MPARIAEHLDLDMPRLQQPSLEIDGGVAKRRGRLGPRERHGGRQILGATDRPHALAAAAGHRLDQQRIADVVRGAGNRRHGRVDIERLARARDDRHADGRGDRTRARLAAQFSMTEGLGPTNVRPASGARLRELRVLREKPVTRMHERRATSPRDVDERADAQIALGRGTGPKVIGLIGEPDVERLSIAVREDRDARMAHLAARADDAHGDLATVGNQHLHDQWNGVPLRAEYCRACEAASSPACCRNCRAPQ